MHRTLLLGCQATKKFRLIFHQHLIEGAAGRAKLGTKRRKTLPSPKNERSLAMLVDSFSSLMAAVVCVAISKRKRKNTMRKFRYTTSNCHFTGGSAASVARSDVPGTFFKPKNIGTNLYYKVQDGT